MGNHSRHQKILLSKEAAAQLHHERVEKVQHHLDELNKNLHVRNIAREVVLRAEINRVGVPESDAEQQAMVDKCERMARRVADFQNREKYEGLRDLLTHLEIKSVPDPLVWIAEKNGIELVKPEVDSLIVVEGTH